MNTNWGIIFDLDGVITNNDAYHKKAFMAFCFNHKIEMNDTIYAQKVVGGTNEDIMKRLFGKITVAQSLVYGAEKEEEYRKLYRPILKPIEGLESFLQMLNDLQIPIGMGTNAPEENVNFVLDGLNLRKYFSHIVRADMVAKGKPAPDVYLEAAKRINRNPENCIVFEDSNTGITAAKAAGTKVIGVLSSHSQDELQTVDLAINNYYDLKISILKKILKVA